MTWRAISARPYPAPAASAAPAPAAGPAATAPAAAAGVLSRRPAHGDEREGGVCGGGGVEGGPRGAALRHPPVGAAHCLQAE